MRGLDSYIQARPNGLYSVYCRLLHGNALWLKDLYVIKTEDIELCAIAFNKTRKCK